LLAGGEDIDARPHDHADSRAPIAETTATLSVRNDSPEQRLVTDGSKVGRAGVGSAQCKQAPHFTKTSAGYNIARRHKPLNSNQLRNAVIGVFGWKAEIFLLLPFIPTA
jgi:hypothetical protein